MNAQSIFQAEIAKYHKEISAQYGPVGLAFEKLHTNERKTIAHYLFGKKQIVYDLEEVAFNGLRRTVLHEFTHHIQCVKFGYTSHDLLFVLINQMLNIKHISKYSFSLNLYDIQDATELHTEEINFFFIADEVSRIAMLEFSQAIIEIKRLEVALLGAREFEDLDYLGDTTDEIIKRKNNYGTIRTTIKKTKKTIWEARTTEAPTRP